MGINKQERKQFYCTITEWKKEATQQIYQKRLAVDLVNQGWQGPEEKSFLP